MLGCGTPRYSHAQGSRGNKRSKSKHQKTINKYMSLSTNFFARYCREQTIYVYKTLLNSFCSTKLDHFYTGEWDWWSGD